MNNPNVKFAFLLLVGFLLAANGVDPQLESAKQVHEAAVAKADAELQRAVEKCAAEKSAADTRLTKAYDEAIKRMTQRGDLETANRLLAEKKAIQAGASANPHASENYTSADAKIKWVPLGKDGVPYAIVITDVNDGEMVPDYLRFFTNPDVPSTFHGHAVTAIKADGDGNFEGPGPKNIEANYYGIYLRAEAAETDTLVLHTTEYGSLKVYLDGKPILKYDANKKSDYLTKIPLALSRGAHVLVVRHFNEWAGNSVGVRILGGNLQTASFTAP